MSAIDRLKELWAAAETECIGAVPCRRCDARTKLEARVHVIGQELVASQEALKCWHSNTGAGGYNMRGEHPERNCMEAEERPDPDDEGCPGRCKPCLALRLDGLEKAMEEK